MQQESDVWALPMNRHMIAAVLASWFEGRDRMGLVSSSNHGVGSRLECENTWALIQRQSQLPKLCWDHHMIRSLRISGIPDWINYAFRHIHNLGSQVLVMTDMRLEKTRIS